MKRILKRIVSLLIALILSFEILPAGALAVNIEDPVMLRFRTGSYAPDGVTLHAVTAEYNGTTYVMGADFTTAVAVPEESFLREGVFELEKNGVAPIQLQERYDGENWTYILRLYGQELTVKNGLLKVTEGNDEVPAWEFYRYRQTPFFYEEGIFHYTGEDATSFRLVLDVSDEENIRFAVNPVVDETHLRCTIAENICRHEGMQRHEGTPATCTESGVRDYWECPLCRDLGNRAYLFLTENGADEGYWYEDQLLENLTEPSLGHADENDDGVCDICSVAMPTFTRVTMPSEIQEGRSYLLAVEIDEALYLLRTPTEMDNFQRVLGSTEAVTVEEDGSILYASMKDADAMLFRLGEAGGKGGGKGGKGGKEDDPGLSGADDLYSVSFSGGTLSYDAGCGFVLNNGSDYGWRVRLDDEAGDGSVAFIPRMMEDIGSQFRFRALIDEGTVRFSVLPAYDEDVENLMLPENTPEYPVYLYIMGGQDVESFDYELSEGSAVTDYTAASSLEGFDPDAVYCEVVGLAEAVTNQTAMSYIGILRTENGSAASHYFLTAYAELTAVEPPEGAEMMLNIALRLNVMDGSTGFDRTFTLESSELDLGGLGFRVYCPFDPQQLAVHLTNGVFDGAVSYRKPTDRLQESGLASPFTVAEDSAYLLVFSTGGGDYPTAVEVRKNAVVEPHDHLINWADEELDEHYVCKEDGHYLECRYCFEPQKVHDHFYSFASCDLDITDENIGEKVYYCSFCYKRAPQYYEKREPIDVSEWAWVNVVDQNGTHVEPFIEAESLSFGITNPHGSIRMYNVLWFKGTAQIRERERVDPEYTDGFVALHYDDTMVPGYGADLVQYSEKPLDCIVRFSDEAKLIYKVPDELVFENVQLGEVVHVDVTKRSGRIITITGTLPKEMRDWPNKRGRLTTVYPEITYYRDLSFNEDGSFAVTAPYAYTELSFSCDNGDNLNWEDCSLVIRSVQTLGDFDADTMTVDLGTLDFKDHTVNNKFYIKVTDEAVARIARNAYRNGKYTLTDETTGESWTHIHGSLPLGENVYAESGSFTFILDIPESEREAFSQRCAVGDEMVLECDIWTSDSDAMEPLRFTLGEVGTGDGTQALGEPEYYKRPYLHIDTSGLDLDRYTSWWGMLFDANGQKLSNRYTGGDIYLEEGDYTYLAYAKNPYIDEVDDPNALELMNIPQKGYYKLEFTARRNESVTATPTFVDFDPYKNVVVTATLGESLRTGESVPVYINYKGFDTDFAAVTGEYGMTIDIKGGISEKSEAAVPLVLVNGHFASWNRAEELTEELIDTAVLGMHYKGVRIFANAPEGTICVYARPEGQTLYITAKSTAANDFHESESSFVLKIPANDIVVQEPPTYTSEPNGKLVYFATLPKNEYGYFAMLHVDGRDGVWEYVNLTGRGANEISYGLGAYGDGTFFHELQLEIYAITAVGESGWIADEYESVWQSPVYHVALNKSAKIPQPSVLNVRARLGWRNYGGTIDLKTSQNRVSSFLFYPNQFNDDGTLNEEMVFDYSLTLDNADSLTEDSIYMTVYCGERRAEPELRQITLIRNEKTGTFDGTLTFEAGTLRLDGLPYGYSFFITNATPDPDSVGATTQAVERLREYAEKLKALEDDPDVGIPEIIDLDLLETEMAADEEMEEWEKEVIRVCADYQNTVHDAWVEIQSVVTEYAENMLQTDRLLELALGDSGNAEILLETVSEEALIQIGYQKAETVLGDYYVFVDFGGTGANSIIFWSDEPSERVHRWSGVSPLPQGRPLQEEEEEEEEEDGLESVEESLDAERLLATRGNTEAAAANAARDAFEAYYSNNFMTTAVTVLSMQNQIQQQVAVAVNKMLDKTIQFADKKAAYQTKELTKLTEKFKADHAEELSYKEKWEKYIQKAQKDYFAKHPNAPKEIPPEQVDAKALSAEYYSTKRALDNMEQYLKSEGKDVDKASTTRERFLQLSKATSDFKKRLASFAAKVSPTLGKALNVLAVITDCYGYYKAYNDLCTEMVSMESGRKAWDDIRGRMAVASSETCLADPYKAYEANIECRLAYWDYVEATFKYEDAVANRADAKYRAVFVDLIAVASTVVAPEISVLGALYNALDDAAQTFYMWRRWSRLEDAENKLSKKCVDPLPFKLKKGCGEEPHGGGGEPEPPYIEPPQYPAPNVPRIDPSGYAYEAVASNRVEGATATIYYRGENGEVIPWEEASVYDEIFEQTTGADGRYEWMTPQGKWLVKVTKEGYEPADSGLDPAAVDGWLPVPPPQMNVNIPMISTAAPTVESAVIAPDRVRVTFSQYMTMTSAYAVSVTKNGEPVNFTPVFIDREESPTQEGIFYGRVLELSGTFSGEGYAVSVSTEAENYAGKRLESAYESASLGVAQLVGSLSHAYPNRFVTDVGDTENLVVVVRDTEGKPMPNAPVTVTEETGGTLSFESRTVVSDAEGRAVFTVTGISSGSDVLTFTADSAGIAMNTRVTSLGTESPKKPTANLTDGETVAYGTELNIYCATEDAVIYYTTDNTCPCTEGESQHRYEGPVAVYETTLFRIAAWTESGGYSERLNLWVVVETPAPTVRMDDGGLTIEHRPKGSVAVAGFYRAGQLLRVEFIEDTSVIWTEKPEDVRVFFLDPDLRPLYSAWKSEN